jgi:putative addiction module component (TIGR02574 family)
MKTEDLLKEIESLPVDERARVVDRVLRSLNPPESAIDKKWDAAVKRRLEEIQSGTVERVPNEEVFDEVWKRFS